jgi:hypothetical protein
MRIMAGRIGRPYRDGKFRGGDDEDGRLSGAVREYLILWADGYWGGTGYCE